MHTLSHDELALLRSVTSKSRIIDGHILKVGRELQREGLVALQSINPKFCHCMITPGGLSALNTGRSAQLKECLVEGLAFAERRGFPDLADLKRADDPVGQFSRVITENQKATNGHVPIHVDNRRARDFTALSVPEKDRIVLPTALDPNRH